MKVVVIVLGVLVAVVFITVCFVHFCMKCEGCEDAEFTCTHLKKLNYTDYPLVSAICVTRKRLPLLKRAIRDFYDQTYRKKELVVVYDEDDTETKEFVKSLPENTVFVENNTKRNSLGALRNMGIKKANGKCVVQWDDDDEYHPNRIEYQLKALQQHSYEKACFLTRWIIFDNSTTTKYVSHSRFWEGSIMATKSLLLKYPYPNLKKGEDTVVVDNLKQDARAFGINFPNLYIYHLHNSNTWDKFHGKKLIKGTKTTKLSIPSSKTCLEKFHELFDSYFINLGSAVEMRSGFEKSANLAGMHVCRFDAIDGMSLKESPSDMSPGEYGCLLSHKHIWNISTKTTKPTVIFEDDVRLQQNTARKIIRRVEFMKNSQIDWDILLLFANVPKDNYKVKYGDCNYTKDDIVSYGIIRFGKEKTKEKHISDDIPCISGLMGYIIKPEIAQKLIQVSDQHSNSLPADIVMSLVMKKSLTFYLKDTVDIARHFSPMSDIGIRGGYLWTGTIQPK